MDCSSSLVGMQYNKAAPFETSIQPNKQAWFPCGCPSKQKNTYKAPPQTNAHDQTTLESQKASLTLMLISLAMICSNSACQRRQRPINPQAQHIFGPRQPCGHGRGSTEGCTSGARSNNFANPITRLLANKKRAANRNGRAQAVVRLASYPSTIGVESKRTPYETNEFTLALNTLFRTGLIHQRTALPAKTHLRRQDGVAPCRQHNRLPPAHAVAIIFRRS